MAANWRKILFEGSNIDVNAIVASGLEELTAASPGVNNLPVLSYTTNDGIFKQIEQSGLNQAVGSTIFTISGSDHTNNTSFDASSHTLVITTSNPTYFGAPLTSTSDTTTITFTPSSDFITSAAQLNIISGSETDFDNGSLGGDWDTAIKPISTSIVANTSQSIVNDGRVSPSDAYSTYPGFNFSQRANLWANYHTDGGGNSETPDPNANIQGRKSIYWISASLLGGFSDGTPSTSASYFTEFTSSITSISASASNLGISASALNDFTGSDNGGALLSANTESIVTSFSSEQEFSIETQLDRDQITFFDTDEDGNTLNQGKRIALGTPTNDTDIQSVDSTARDLAIEGTFTADSYGLGFGLEFQQVNIQRINGGINFGTSSLHTHRLFGNTFITGNVDITGDMHFGGSDGLSDHAGHDPAVLPSVHNDITDGSPFQVMAVDNNGQFGYVHMSGSAFAAIITGSANDTITLFETDIASVNAITATATADANDIDDLEEGFTTNSDSLQTLYERGILFSYNNGGSKVVPLETASFSGTEDEGTDVLTTSYTADNKVKYTLFPSRLADAALKDADGRIYTSSVAISQSAVSLNRYNEADEGILTGSNAASATNFIDSFSDDDILYIQNLASDLGADKEFITSSGDFSDLADFSGVNQVTSGTPQGVIEFKLDGTYKFGATGSKMHTGGNPVFNNLIVDGNLTVDGTITKVNKSNLNVKDQFILINSGAKAPTGENTSANDKDGGIIVGAGDLSGSLLMYDFTQRSWGFLGSQEADNVGNEIESFDDNGLTPEATVRVIRHDSGPPPSDINTILYGISTGHKQKGIMYVDTVADDVFIYA